MMDKKEEANVASFWRNHAVAAKTKQGTSRIRGFAHPGWMTG
jgi:hypothetical protein